MKENIIAVLIRLAFLIFTAWLEKDRAKKKKKEEIISEVKNGLKNNDSSAVTGAFNKLNRM